MAYVVQAQAYCFVGEGLVGRPSKIEVSAVNIRIPAEMDRKYSDLIELIVSLKVGVKVYGNTYVAITTFDRSTGVGAFSKYSEIDIDGDWFDIDSFGLARPEQVDEVMIPDSLRPNFSSFYFILDASLHVIVFETYSESKNLSSRSVQKYFDEILGRSEISNVYGYIEADIIKSYGEVERILALPDLRELRIIIRRPNPDDVSGDLARIIEERLREQKGEEYEEILRSKDRDGLEPNERTKKLSVVAAENGQVIAKSLVNGVMSSHDTEEKPQKEVESFNKDEIAPRSVFLRLAEKLFGRVRSSRQNIIIQDSGGLDA
ncbi:DUF4747 family protein [Xanthobacter versatilis]|uniref:DUF4747 family protein n=1 Tax=Xanthobacter autotrophicus (strain ATCC BAA-1158 / Py2) TaxID=78245 RepID=UPI0037283E06